MRGDVAEAAKLVQGDEETRRVDDSRPRTGSARRRGSVLWQSAPVGRGAPRRAMSRLMPAPDAVESASIARVKAPVWAFDSSVALCPRHRSNIRRALPT